MTRSSDSQELCARYRDVEPNESLTGTDGAVDRYVRDIRLDPAVDAKAAFAGLVDRLLRYDVFPPSIMRPVICSPDGLVHDGTVIIQRLSIGPFRMRPAVRVIRLWRTADADREEAGYTYATMPGHPEQGVSSFVLSRDAHAGRVTFSIVARSRPGSILTRLGRPVARWYQRRATLAALDHVAGRG